jgi:chemotaxis protein CheC
MELTAFQKDALTELINIGYGRAAGALSELTGYRVTVDVPSVTLHSVEDIGPILENTLSSQVANVNQNFSGPVSGNALLLMNEASAKLLSRMLDGNAPVTADFDTSAQEIIKEVGNILLNACLGVFGNILQIHVRFSVPRLQIGHVSRVMRHDPGSAEKSSHGLLVHTRFHVKSADITGYLVIVLGLASFDRLMLELEKWDERENSAGPKSVLA